MRASARDEGCDAYIILGIEATALRQKPGDGSSVGLRNSLRRIDVDVHLGHKVAELTEIESPLHEGPSRFDYDDDTDIRVSSEGGPVVGAEDTGFLDTIFLDAPIFSLEFLAQKAAKRVAFEKIAG